MTKPLANGERKRGKRGLGSVYQRTSDGRWVGEVSRTVDGQRERTVVTAQERQGVLDQLDELRRQWKRSAPRRRDRSMTVARYLDDWLPKMKRRVAPTTYQSREQHVRVHIKPVLATRRLGRLSVKDVESLLDGVVTKGASPRTAGHVRATLRVALQEAIRDGLLDRNVAADARAPRVRVPEMKALSPTQARALIEATKEDDLGVLWLTLLSTGLRAGEACGLSWGDIDEDRRVIHVRRQWARGDSGYELRELKTEASKRTVSISAEVTAALAGLRSGGETNEDPVFHTAAGDRLDVTQLSGALRKDLERAGLPVVRVHDLRHTAASLMLGAGADIVAVSRVLGHSTVVTTLNTYAHTDEARKADAVERLRKAITSG